MCSTAQRAKLAANSFICFYAGEDVNVNDLKVGLVGEKLVDGGLYFSFPNVNCRHNNDVCEFETRF